MSLPMRNSLSDGPIVSITRAMDFAAHKHATQRRKGIRAESYVIHLTEVARLLAEATDGADPGLVMAGMLHDTVEDTDTTPQELASTFGPEIASIVAEVTDDKSLDKQERRRLQIQTAPGKSLRARMLKIADKIANLRSIRESPPIGWTAHRKSEYVAWAREVVKACGQTNALLEAWFEVAAAALE
jgi:(p)ppGpp synthase/HD superfamily hydrolase